MLVKTNYESLNQLSDIGRMLVIPKTKFDSSHQKASPQASKNTSGVLVPCHTEGTVPIAISGGVDISEVPGCHLQ